jgi:hypothetical protein
VITAGSDAVDGDTRPDLDRLPDCVANCTGRQSSKGV